MENVCTVHNFKVSLWEDYPLLCGCCLYYILITFIGSKTKLRGRASAHGAMGHWIDHSWWIHWAIFHSSQWSRTGINCNKSCNICYPVYGMMHIKPMLLIKNSPCSVDSEFPLWLHEWSFTICPTLVNRKQNVLSVSLNKISFITFTACSQSSRTGVGFTVSLMYQHSNSMLIFKPKIL